MGMFTFTKVVLQKDIFTFIQVSVWGTTDNILYSPGCKNNPKVVLE